MKRSRLDCPVLGVALVGCCSFQALLQPAPAADEVPLVRPAAESQADGSPLEAASRGDPVPWYVTQTTIDEIEGLAPWPSSGDFTPRQWYKYCSMAESLSARDAQDVVALFVAYMILIDQPERGQAAPVPVARDGEAVDRPSTTYRRDLAAAKLMILLRLMFEIPADARSVAEDDGTPYLWPAGGFPIDVRPDASPQTAFYVATPVGWRDGRPALSANFHELHPGEMVFVKAYRPELEYCRMERKFKIRANWPEIKGILTTIEERSKPAHDGDALAPHP